MMIGTAFHMHFTLLDSSLRVLIYSSVYDMGILASGVERRERDTEAVILHRFTYIMDQNNL